MILNLIDYIIPNFFLDLLLIVLVFSFFYSLKFWPNEGEEDKTKLKDSELFESEKDVLGQPLKVYSDRSRTFRPMGKINFRVGLLVVIIFFASFLIFQNSKKVESISGAGGYSFLNEMKKRPYYKLYNDPMFPADYYIMPVNYNDSKTKTSGLDSALKYINVPYYTKN